MGRDHVVFDEYVRFADMEFTCPAVTADGSGIVLRISLHDVIARWAAADYESLPTQPSDEILETARRLLREQLT